MPVHRCDFVLERHEEEAPTTPGMKYRHYVPGVPVTLLYTSPPPARPGAWWRVRFLGMKPDAARPVALASWRKTGRPLLVRARSEEAQWLTLSLCESTEPARAAQRLFEGLLSLEERA